LIASEVRRRHSGTPVQPGPQIKAPAIAARRSPAGTPIMEQRNLNPVINRNTSSIGGEELNGSFIPREPNNIGQRQQGAMPIPRSMFYF